MNETWYDKEEDILSVRVEDGTYWKSVEISEGIVIDIQKDGTILGLEIPQASRFFSGDNKKVLSHAIIKTAKA